MVSPVELIARTVGLQHAKPEILAASAELTRRILASTVHPAVSLRRSAG
jgi:hypothetical protein